MSTLNLTPITKESQPTSHVRLGQSKVGPTTDVVRVRHRGHQAHFRVETEDDRITSSIKNKVYLNGNAEALFGGIDRSKGSEFHVDTDASLGSIPRCERATLFAPGVNEEHLVERLREEEYLLHGIEEVAHFGAATVEFHVCEMEPSGYPTLRVTDETTFEFTDEAPTDPTAVATAEDPTAEGGAQDEADEVVSIDLTPRKPENTFEDDVAGLEGVKQTAQVLLALFDEETSREVVERYGESFASRGNGMLLYGPPGCGKTLVSEAIASEAKYNTDIERQYGEVKFLEIKGSDVLSKYQGESEKRVEAIFDQAHDVAQDGFCVLFFDEVETLVPNRSDDSLQRHERSLTNAFLQEMNDIEDNLLVIGATNMPFTMDPAATRRFPIQQFIPQPDERVMAEVWRKHLTSLPNAEEIDFERLGEESVGYTPAEIADRVLGSDLQREFVLSVVERNREPIEPDTEYLLDRLRSTEPKTVRQYVSKVRPQIDDLEGFPELKRYVGDQVEEMGIQPAGDATGGLGRLVSQLQSSTGVGDGGAGDGSDTSGDRSSSDGGDAADERR